MGSKIKAFREKKHVSENEIAEYVGMSRSTYRHIEEGKREPKVSELIAIIEYLNINLSDVLEYRKPRISTEAIRSLAVGLGFQEYKQRNGQVDLSPKIYELAKSVIQKAHESRV